MVSLLPLLPCSPAPLLPPGLIRSPLVSAPSQDRAPKVHGKSLGVCLGDLFSIKWMEDTDAADETKETLSEQFVAVRNAAIKRHAMSSPRVPCPPHLTPLGDTCQVRNATFKSHVMSFGNTSFTETPLATFLGDETNHTARRARVAALPKGPRATAVDSRDAKLQYLQWRVMSLQADGQVSSSLEELTVAQRELAAEISARHAASALFTGVWRRLTGSDGRDLLTSYMPPRSFECHRAVMAGARLVYTDYSLKFHKVVVNLCERGFGADQINAAFAAERETVEQAPALLMG